MIEQGYYEPYDAFKELYHTSEVNEHIKDGSWVLLKIGEITTSESLAGGVSTNTRLVYIVGHKKPVGNPAPTDSQRGPPSAGSPAASSATGRQPAQPAKPKMTGISSPCKYCQGPIWWAKEGGKNVPKNEDGSRHNCR